MVKASLTLSADEFAVLKSQASPRKRGELVSKRLIEYGAGAAGVDTINIEAIKLQLLGLASANKTLEGRVMKMERQWLP